MKCQELQIRDWITDVHGFPMQIVIIGEDYAYATFDGNECDPWEFDDKDDQPHPIGITVDFLKADGWEVHSYTLPHNFKAYFCVKDENGNHLQWNSEVLSIWFDYEKDNDGVYADIIIPCKYVHQLQHVLRLAGMTDLANNFKIK